MRFAHPWLLAVLPLALGALAGALLWGRQRRRQLADIFTGDPTRTWSAPGFSVHRQRWDLALSLVAVGALLLALARPLLFVESDRHEMQGVNYVVAIDASRSMLATDVRPSRYAAVTNALDAWFAQVRADRIGLVTFAGAAYLNAPLTFDTAALRLILRYVEPEDLTEGGSDLAAAIDRAARYFATNHVDQRLLILVSDGEELDGDAVEAARRVRTQFDLTVCTIGVGTSAGARILAERSERGRGAVRNRFGQEIVTRLDEGRLQRIASAGGGRFYPLGPQGEGLASLRREVISRVAEAAARGNLRNYRELCQWPLALALAALVAKLALRADSRRAVGTPAPQSIVR